MREEEVDREFSSAQESGVGEAPSSEPSATGRDRITLLEAELTKNLRKPWLSFRDYIIRRLAFVAARIAKPFSKKAADRFRRSAEKRNPRRFISPPQVVSLPEPSYADQTRTILERYFPSGYEPPAPPLHLQLGSASIVSRRLAAAPISAALPNKNSPDFSIITPFFAHFDFFKECANSVAALANQTRQFFEWVIVNDDPSISNDCLLDCLPKALHARSRIIGGEKNHGIVRALDRGIREASHNWLVMLDCDDMIEPTALDVLADSIIRCPSYRYFSAQMIDIDEDGRELRRRRPEHSLIDLFQAGMIAGHMMAFRKDLYDELGGYDIRFSGVQDYDFALRASAREKIARIPHHLYRYRFHANSQSIARLDRQDKLTNAVRKAFLRETMGLQTKHQSRGPLPKAPETLCIIRTQGNRMDLLEEAIESTRSQVYPMTPCIVVHGDHSTYDFVRHHLPNDVGGSKFDRPAIVLHAHQTELKRGYPVNVAIDHLASGVERFDLVCLLDDDDRLLPNFAERLVELIQVTGADMAYGMSNAVPKNGDPFVQHALQPWPSILGGNFITSNGFLIRADALLASGVRFPNDLHYLEDHHFLVQLFCAGIRAEPLIEVVSEYRLIGDGSIDVKSNYTLFQYCREQVSRLPLLLQCEFETETWLDQVLSFPAQESEVDLEILKRSFKQVRKEAV